MKRKRPDDLRQVLAAMAVILGVSAILIIQKHAATPFIMIPDPWGSNSAHPEATVRRIVDYFGSRLQDVSLTASPVEVKQEIRSAYANVVWPDLLSKWIAAPAEAPGRLTSSPWPDHINIASITPMNDTTYAIEGNVVEITSQELADGGIADQYPVFMTVENQGGNWFITDYRDALAR